MSTMSEQNTQRQGANSNISMTNSGQNQKVLNELPPPDTKRWVISRKAAVVAAVKNGAITVDEVCRQYDISVEEFLTWQEMIEKRGIRGLRVTKLQEFRVS